MGQTLLPLSYGRELVPGGLRGVVTTKVWVVELLLDLAGYLADADLVDALVIEPAAGKGAFLVALVGRLIGSCARLGRPFSDCLRSLVAYEIDENSAEDARKAVFEVLCGLGVGRKTAEELASGWIRAGDFLVEAPRLSRADFVVGNPPYIRLEDIPEETASHYRRAYPTMRGRADLYGAFFEAALRGLKDGGVCAYLVADRWMFNQYNAEI